MFLAGDFGVKNKKVGDVLYVKCKHKPFCDGSAKISLISNLLEPGRGFVRPNQQTLITSLLLKK